jgi:hypothetical protein
MHRVHTGSAIASETKCLACAEAGNWSDSSNCDCSGGTPGELALIIMSNISCRDTPINAQAIANDAAVDILTPIYNLVELSNRDRWDRGCLVDGSNQLRSRVTYP